MDSLTHPWFWTSFSWNRAGCTTSRSETNTMLNLLTNIGTFASGFWCVDLKICSLDILVGLGRVSSSRVVIHYGQLLYSSSIAQWVQQDRSPTLNGFIQSSTNIQRSRQQKLQKATQQERKKEAAFPLCLQVLYISSHHDCPQPLCQKGSSPIKGIDGAQVTKT